jgi:hypothetical protein
MKEAVLHYIWQHKLFVQHNLRTTDGESVVVIDVGTLNTNAGPDFFNAKIKIGKTIWAGNVEIHTCSSDWNKHNHQSDPAYNNVILHIVKHVDVPVFLADGEKVPQLELQYSESIEQNYTTLLASKLWVPCGERVMQLCDFEISHWMTALLIERMSDRVQDINLLLTVNNHFWEEAFFCQLCRSFGFSVNGDVFFSMGKSVPWMVIQKNQNSLFQLEALLFGQSGQLSKTTATDAYVEKLKQEYAFLQQKYQLQMIAPELWRLLRMRPDNFPQIRIAQLVSLLVHHKKLFSKIIDQPDVKAVSAIFENIEPSEYWKTHYLFGIESVEKTKRIGRSSIHQILINAVVPMLCCYAAYKNNQELHDKAIAMLDELPPENNYIIRKWTALGLKVKSAADSQSLLHLYKHYCEEKKCLRCSIGYKLLTSSSNL